MKPFIFSSNIGLFVSKKKLWLRFYWDPSTFPFNFRPQLSPSTFAFNFRLQLSPSTFAPTFAFNLRPNFPCKLRLAPAKLSALTICRNCCDLQSDNRFRQSKIHHSIKSTIVNFSYEYCFRNYISLRVVDINKNLYFYLFYLYSLKLKYLLRGRKVMLRSYSYQMYIT